MAPPRDACDSVLAVLSEGDALPEPLAAHARGCATCAPLTRLSRALDVPPRGELAMGEALREALAEAAPVRRASSWSRAAPSLLVLAGVVVAQTGAGLAGRAGAPLGALLVATSGAGVALVFTRGPDGLGSPARLRRLYPLGAAALAATAVALRGGAIAGGASEARALTSPGTAIDAVTRLGGARADDVTATFATAVVVTAIAATAALLGARRTTPNLPALSGATAGASAALLGLAVAHQGALPGAGLAAFAHVAVVVVAAAVAAVVGRASLAP